MDGDMSSVCESEISSRLMVIDRRPCVLACTSQQGTKATPFPTTPTELARPCPTKSPWHTKALGRARQDPQFDVGLDHKPDGRCHETEVHEFAHVCVCTVVQGHVYTTFGLVHTHIQPHKVHPRIPNSMLENSVKFLSSNTKPRADTSRPGKVQAAGSTSFDVRPKQDKTSGPAVGREGVPRLATGLVQSGEPEPCLGSD